MRFLIFILMATFLYGQKACPDCYGAGSEATGGRGKKLAHITSLDRNAPLVYDAVSDTYSGGLYPALQESNVGYIVPDITGYIEVGVGGTGSQYSSLGMPNVSDKTYLGQLAPQGGITLTGGTFRLNYANNVIFQHLRSRPRINSSGNLDTDDDAYTWGLLFYGGNDFVVKNSSFSFAHDKALGAAIDENNLSLSQTLYRHTYQNNLIADAHTGYYIEINERPGEPDEFVDRISVLGNLSYAVNRTPNMSFTGTGELINNISLDIPGKATSSFHGIKLNQINNYYQTFASNGWNRILAYISNDNDPEIFAEGNYFDGASDVLPTDNQRLMWIEEFLSGQIPPAPASYFTSTRHTTGFPNPYPEVSASQAFTDLVTNEKVGANQYMDDNGYLQTYYDTFDASMISNSKNGVNYTPKQASNWVNPTLPSNTRSASYDTDNDGLSDAWEQRNFGNLNQSYGDDPDGDGYENIEEKAYGTNPNVAEGSNPSPPTTLVDFQAVFEELVQAPAASVRHRDNYSHEFYQNNLIQDRKTLLDNYMNEADHLLWGTGFVFAESVPTIDPLSAQGEANARRDEPYFSGAHPEYDTYTNYTNALHVAAQYAFLFTQDAYDGMNVTINGTTKLASQWAVDISQKVLKDLHDTVTDDDLDIWNGTYRTNATWGTATRYTIGDQWRPINPYFVSISKASAMWDSFALISQVIPTDATFQSQQQIIYDWLDYLGDFVEAGLDVEFNYYPSSTWINFGNYETNYQNGAITGQAGSNQTYFYYDSGGNPASSKLHASADVGNNRNFGSLEYLFKTATYTKNATLRTKAEAYLRRIMESSSNEGGSVDIQRNNGQGTNPLNYSHITVSELAMIVAHDAIAKINQGETNTYADLYDQLYPEGIEDRFPSLDSTFETANANKNAKLVFDYHSSWVDNTTRYGFDSNLITTENGTLTAHAQIGQMFGSETSYTNYLDSFNTTNTYTTSLWGTESLAAWHKWETVFGGMYSFVDMPNLFPQAATARANLGSQQPESEGASYVGERRVIRSYVGDKLIND